MALPESSNDATGLGGSEYVRDLVSGNASTAALGRGGSLSDERVSDDATRLSLTLSVRDVRAAEEFTDLETSALCRYLSSSASTEN